jgi:uncharacterized protein with von Willebrand factor type A (vWA) domain
MDHMTAGEIGRLTGSIVRQVTDFAPWLRNRGFRAGVPETFTALPALTDLNLSSIDEVCSAFRSIYARTPAEWGIFPTLFGQYFGIREARLEEKRRLQPDDLMGGTSAGEKAERPPLEITQGVLAGYHPNDGERFALRADGQVL